LTDAATAVVSMSNTTLAAFWLGFNLCSELGNTSLPSAGKSQQHSQLCSTPTSSLALWHLVEIMQSHGAVAAGYWPLGLQTLLFDYPAHTTVNLTPPW